MSGESDPYCLVTGVRVLLLAPVLILSFAFGCAKDEQPEAPRLDDPALASNWPGFMGPMGRSVADGRVVPAAWSYSNAADVLWSVNLDKAGYSSPIVWGDRVFVSQADESGNELLCVDLAAGARLWAVSIGRHVGSTSEGLKLFSDEMHASSTPVTDGKLVYALFSSGDIACVDFSGRKIWERDLGFQAIKYGYASSPVLYKGKLIVQLEEDAGPYIVALDPGTGEELWRAERPDRSWSTPVIYKHAGREELLCASISALSAHSLDDGRQLWVVDDAMDGEFGSSAAWEGNMIFVNSTEKGVRAYRITSDGPKFVWQWDEGLTEMASPLAFGGNVYIASQVGAVFCLDGMTGLEKWRVKAADQFFATPVCVDGKVYAASRDGIIIRMDAGDGPGEVGRFHSADFIEAIPAFVGAKIVVRAPHKLICYGK